jgi:hypothetical protein
MAFTIEPMVNLGGPEVRQLADGWTLVTAEGRPLRPVRAHRAGDPRGLRGADTPQPLNASEAALMQ